MEHALNALLSRAYAKPLQRRYAALPYNSYCLRRRALLGQFCVSPIKQVGSKTHADRERVRILHLYEALISFMSEKKGCLC